MKNFSLLIQVLIISILFNFPASGFSLGKDFSETENLMEDIKIINLLNNLDLRDEQAEFILSKAEEIKRIRDSSKEKARSLSPEITETCKAIKEEVSGKKVFIDSETAKNFHMAKEEMETTQKEVLERMDNIAKSVEQRLEPFQLNALDDYTACIIPKISKGRIGQADSGEGLVNALERVKKMPEARYEEQKTHLAEKLIERIKKHYPPQETLNEAHIKSKLLKTFEEVRDMEDVEFELKKEDIAKGFEETSLPKKKEMSRAAKIKKFLLSENIIPILKERLN